MDLGETPWTICGQFQAARREGDAAFASHPMAAFVRDDLPAAVIETLRPEFGHLEVEGSAGRGGWTHTPWAAALDPRETMSVQEGLYLVYLFSADGERFYLSLNQGCTILKDAVGIPSAHEELRRRALVARRRLTGSPGRFASGQIDLASDLWRARLYESGNILNIAYALSDRPNENTLRDDLLRGAALNQELLSKGGWSAEDEVIAVASGDGRTDALDQALVYRMHRRLERLPSHARAVKRVLGQICMGCDVDLVERYGELADGLAEAHHLTPLHTLTTTVALDPRKDFAVLCPTCHRLIHRLTDPSDLNALRQLARR